MNQPRVSVIIIFFNEARFLAEAINSVFAQSFGDWELLLVDDGSTDASPDIAGAFVRKNPRQVRYLTHPRRVNRGMSASRNLGLGTATGEYVGFLDADDIWLPEKLDEQISIMEREAAAAMVYGRTLIWRSWNAAHDLGGDFFYDLGVPPSYLYPPPVLFETLLSNQAQSPTTCNALIRRCVLEEIGGFEESFHGMFEDQVFFSKVLLNAPVFVADCVWAKYRQHATSCTAISSSAGNDVLAYTHFLRWASGYLKQQASIDPAVRRALRRAYHRNRIAAVRNTLSRLLPVQGAR
jgi:glycosyltransferase involved in cell wall biosynthesis